MTDEALRTVCDPSAPLTARRTAWLHLKSQRGQRVRQWRFNRRQNAVLREMRAHTATTPTGGDAA